MLHKCAQNGKAKLAEILVRLKADVNAKNSDGHDPLKFASQFQYEGVLAVLLSQGAQSTLPTSPKGAAVQRVPATNAAAKYATHSNSITSSAWAEMEAPPSPASPLIE